MVYGRKKDRTRVCMCTPTNITSDDNNPVEYVQNPFYHLGKFYARAEFGKEEEFYINPFFCGVGNVIYARGYLCYSTGRK